MRPRSIMIFSCLFSTNFSNFQGSSVGVVSLEAWWFRWRGGTMFSLHELPANPLIKHANGCNCSWW